MAIGSTTAADVIVRFVPVGGPAVAAQADEVAASTAKVGTAAKDTTVAQDEMAASTKRNTAAMTGFAAIAKTAAFLGITLGIGASIKAASSFQNEMMKIHTLAGASIPEMQRMSHWILANAANLRQTPIDMAQALYHLESVGIGGSKAMRLLSLSSKAAAMSGANLTDVTNILDSVQVSGIKHTGDYASVMGQLIATVGTGDMTMQDYANTLRHGLLTTAAQYGLTLNDVNAAMSVFGDNLVRGRHAATLFRQVVTGLAAPTTTAQKGLEDMGMSAFQLSYDLRKPDGLMTALTDIRQHMEALPGGIHGVRAGYDVARAFGFGYRSAGALMMIQELDRLGNKQQLQLREQDKFDEKWKAFTTTTHSTMLQLKALGQVILIDVGSVLMIALKPLGWFVTALTRGRWWAILLGYAITSLVVGFGALALGLKLTAFWQSVMAIRTEAATGGIIAQTVALIAAAAAAYEEAGALAAMNVILEATPVGWILLAISALVIAFILLDKHVKIFHNSVHAVWSWIKKNWPSLGPTLLGPFWFLFRIMGWFTELKSMVNNFGDWIVAKFEWVGKKLKNLWESTPIGGIIDAAVSLAKGHPLAAAGEAVHGITLGQVPNFAPGGTQHVVHHHTGVSTPTRSQAERTYMSRQSTEAGTTSQPDTGGTYGNVTVPVTMNMDSRKVGHALARAQLQERARH